MYRLPSVADERDQEGEDQLAASQRLLKAHPQLCSRGREPAGDEDNEGEDDGERQADRQDGEEAVA